MIRSLAAWSVMLLLAQASAVAEIGRGHFEVGGELGGSEFDAAAVASGGLRISMRGGYFFTERLELEGELSCLYGREQGAPSDERFSVCTGFVNGVLNLRGATDAVPYLRLGLGDAQLDRAIRPNVFEVEDSSTAVQLGLGCRFFVGQAKRLAVRADAAWLRAELFGERSVYSSVGIGVAYRMGRGASDTGGRSATLRRTAQFR